MALQDGEQVLPTAEFEGFSDEGTDSNDISDLIKDDKTSDKDDEGSKIIADTVSKGSNDLDDDTGGLDNTNTKTTTNTDTDNNTGSSNTDNTDDSATETDGKVITEEDDYIPLIPEVEAETAKVEETKPLTKRERFEQYSRGVQKRINKEVKQREALRVENLALQQRMTQLEQNIQNTSVNNEVSVLDNRIRNATSMKQQALEEADYSRVAEIDNDVLQMQIRKNQIDNYRTQQEYAQANYVPQQPAQQPAQQPVQSPHLENVPQAQQNWIKGNQTFGKDQGYTSYVNETYDSMIEAGYNPEDPAMYAELDRRIGRIKAQVVAPTPTHTPTVKSRVQSAPSPNTGEQATAHKRGNTLTEADKINMRGWKLNPNDPIQRREWLANKRKR